MNHINKLTLRYFLKKHWQKKWLFLTMIIFLVGGVVAEMVIPLFYKEMFDLLVEGSADRSIAVSGMLTLLLYIFLVYLVHNFCWRIANFLTTRFQTRTMAEIGNECVQYMNKHSYRFFTHRFAGALVRRVRRLVDSFERFADRIYYDFTKISLKLIISVSVIYWFSPLISLILVIWVILFVVYSYYIARWKYKYDAKTAAEESKISARLADVITNTTNLKLFTAHQHEQKGFEKVTERWRGKARISWDIHTWIDVIQSILMMALEVSVMYIFIQLWNQKLVTAGFFILIQSYVIGLMHQLWDFNRMVRDIFRAFADSEEMITILNTPHEIQDAPNARHLKVKNAEVEFKNVTFCYEKGKNVLKNFNLSIKAGEKIALVGHSGEGKTTLAKLLMRFFDIQKGEILIDGQNIAQVTQESLRSNISLVPQDPILFHRTLFENIRYGKRSATQKEVEVAAKLANCHKFIAKFSKGYGTHVGERGIKLSGGERQRVAIARAILENAPLVILDEATSSLDSHAEKLIQQALHRLLEGKTAIIIAHRLSTIMECDRIIVMQKGKIAEMGTHSELLKKKAGIYSHLWAIQAGGFIGD